MRQRHKIVTYHSKDGFGSYESYVDNTTGSIIFEFRPKEKKFTGDISFFSFLPAIHTSINKGTTFVAPINTEMYCNDLCYVFYTRLVDYSSIRTIVFGYNKVLYKIPIEMFKRFSVNSNSGDEMTQLTYLKMGRCAEYIISKG